MPENSCFGNAIGHGHNGGHQYQQARASRLRQGIMGATSHGAPPLPVLLPTWKLYENPLVKQAFEEEEETEKEIEDFDDPHHHNKTEFHRRVSVKPSAGFEVGACRFFPKFKDLAVAEEEKKELLEALDQSPSPRSHLQFPLSNSDSPPSAGNLQHSKTCKASLRSPQSPAITSPHVKTITLMQPIVGQGASRLISKSSSSTALGKGALGHPTTLKGKYDTSDSKTFKSPHDLMSKGSRRFHTAEQKQMENSPIVSALSDELKRALNRVQELEISQISARKEFDGLLKRFADDRAMLKMREQEKIQAAVFSVTEELGKERKARRKLEIENRKLSRSLAEASKTVTEVEKELDKERKARQLMEDVCDELAKEIGEDRAEVEELKREHAKAREEMEAERRTLMLTEAWREERVQMKLSEAKLLLDEKFTAMDKMKMQLEMFLKSKQIQRAGYFDRDGETLRDAIVTLHAEISGSMVFLDDMRGFKQTSRDDAASSDDVHSLCLSRDNIRGQSDWVLNCNANGSGSPMMENSREDCDQDSAGDSESGNSDDHADFHGQDRSRKLAMASSRDEAIRSCQVGPKELTSSSDSNYEEDKLIDEAYKEDVESENTGSQWDYADVERYNGQGSTWDRDCGETRDAVQDECTSGSASDVEDSNESRYLPERNNSNDSEHVIARYRKERLAQKQALGDNVPEAKDYPLFQYQRNPVYAENDKAGTYTGYRENSFDPGFKGWAVVDPACYNGYQGRNGYLESSKSSRNNTVKAKLLLEDKVYAPKFQLRQK